MSSYIQNLLDDALGDGARSSKFECEIHIPNTKLFPNSTHMASMIKAVSFPGKENSTIDLKYKGRNIPLRGQTKYSHSWDCTFYNTEDHALKNAFEVWLESLEEVHNSNPYIDKLEETKDIHKERKSYTAPIIVSQLGFDSNRKSSIYIIENSFPTKITEIQNDYGEPGKITEFTVTFSYSHYSLYVMEPEEKSWVAKQIQEMKDSFEKEVKGVKNGITESLASGLKVFSRENTATETKKQTMHTEDDMEKTIFDHA